MSEFLDDLGKKLAQAEAELERQRDRLAIAVGNPCAQCQAENERLRFALHRIAGDAEWPEGPSAQNACLHDLVDKWVDALNEGFADAQEARIDSAIIGGILLRDGEDIETAGFYAEARRVWHQAGLLARLLDATKEADDA